LYLVNDFFLAYRAYRGIFSQISSDNRPATADYHLENIHSASRFPLRQRQNFAMVKRKVAALEKLDADLYDVSSTSNPV
jgi:hypothetical protein